MTYPFVCKNEKCEKHNVVQEITMKMVDYTADGHYCTSCNSEMERTVESLVCGMTKDNTSSFYETTRF